MKQLCLCGLTVLCCFWGGLQAGAASSLHWNVAGNKVNADIDSLELVDVLAKIAEATGWQVYLEPGTKRTVSTRFKNRSPDKALDLLLGDLNRVLLPATNGAPRLLVFRTIESQATHRIKSKGNDGKREKPIANEVIITVQPGTDVEALASLLGAKITGQVQALNIYRLEFEDEASAAKAREQLAKLEEVTAIDNNYSMARDVPSESFPAGWPLNLVPKAVPDGDRIIVGLIDTAIEPQKGGINDFLLPGLTMAGEANHPDEVPLHGDSMAQTILRGVAMMQNEPEPTAVRILPVDVYGNSPSTTTFDVARGVYEAINAGAMIINLSLGSEGDSPFLRQVIQSGHEQGVVFFAAAGNEPTAVEHYPAAYPEVIAVTSRDLSGQIASYANRGDFVDISTPGVASVLYDGQAWRVGGTSVSTAYASGSAAALKQQTGLDWKQIEQLIRERLAVAPTAKSSP